MKNTYSVITRITVKTEVDKEIVDSDDYNPMILEDNLHEAIRPVLEKYGAEWESTRSLYLDPETMNCEKCVSCGQWMTNESKPEPILGLARKDTKDLRGFCDECSEWK
jgi:hypothetical protein